MPNELILNGINYSFDVELKNELEKLRDLWKSTPYPSLNSNLGSLQHTFLGFAGEWFRFIREFIQNADDAGSNEIKIKVKDRSIFILNNGRPFSKKDLLGICTKDFSQKSPEESIGFLGIGFKSVFFISDKVEIFSFNRESKKYFSFSFDKDVASEEFYKDYKWKDQIREDIREYIFQIYPLLIDVQQDIEPEVENYNVLFKIEVKSIEMRDKFIEWICDKNNLNPRILLFLKHLKKITLETPDKKIQYVKEMKPEMGYEVVTISGGEEILHYLLFKKTIKIPEDIREREKEILRKYRREKIEEREIYVAFKLDDKLTLTKEEQATLHILPYSFVPLKETPLQKLKFIIGGDFLTDLSRSRVILENEWNICNLENIYKIIEKDIIPVFKQDERFKYNFLTVLWGKTWNEIIDKNLMEKIKNYINTAEVFLTIDNKWVSKERVVMLPKDSDILDILGEKIKEVIKDKEILHPNFEVPNDLEEDGLEKEIMIEFSTLISYLRDYFNQVVERFTKMSLEEKQDVILRLARLYVNYLSQQKDKEKVNELLGILENIKLESKSGKTLPIKDMFLPSEISFYRWLEKIVDSLRNKLGKFFTTSAESAPNKEITYEFLDIRSLGDIAKDENVKKLLRELLRIISRDRIIEKEKNGEIHENLIKAIKENLSYNIVMAYLQEEFKGRELSFSPVYLGESFDFELSVNGEKKYIEVKSSTTTNFRIQESQLEDFINDPKSKLFVVLYDKNYFFLEYGPSYVKVWEVDIEKLYKGKFTLEVSLEETLKKKECKLTDLLKFDESS